MTLFLAIHKQILSYSNIKHVFTGKCCKTQRKYAKQGKANYRAVLGYFKGGGCESLQGVLFTRVPPQCGCATAT